MTDGVELEREGEEIIIRIPMELKRRQGRKEVIAPKGFDASGPPKAPAQEPLVTALARAFAWQELIETGRYSVCLRQACMNPPSPPWYAVPLNPKAKEDSDGYAEPHSPAYPPQRRPPPV
jgi:hypothetical protein